MIKNLLKYLVLASVLFLAPNINAQLYEKFPTNIKYIGGGFNDKNPFYKTLEAALNKVKATATSENPYGFWLASDTLWIADWDSVFTESGLTMKDSIDIYYVATGKIKWMPFGFGGSGGSATIIAQDKNTLHYNWPTWDQTNLALPLWQRQMGAMADSADEEVWRLIVYTQNPLYIENDTLKIDTTGLGSSSGWNPDTTTVLRTTGTQASSATMTWSGTNTNTGTVQFSGSGNIQLPASNGATGTPRRLWGTTSNIYYSGAGGAGDTNSVAMIDLSTGELRNAVVGYNTLTAALQDTITYTESGTATFTTTNSSMNVAVTGMLATSVVILTPVQADSSTAVSALDDVRAIPYSGGFYIKRSLGGTSALKVNWIWVRP